MLASLGRVWLWCQSPRLQRFIGLVLVVGSLCLGATYAAAIAESFANRADPSRYPFIAASISFRDLGLCLAWAVVGGGLLAWSYIGRAGPQPLAINRGPALGSGPRFPRVSARTVETQDAATATA